MKRDRQARWDAAHLKTVGTKLDAAEWLELRARCLAESVTPYALVKRLVREWMSE